MTAKLVNPLLVEHAEAIRAIGKKTVENVIEIGRRLTECKRIAGHGNWLPWLEREFGWSEDTAERFIQLSVLSNQIPQLAEFRLPITGLYLLSAPSTPESARTEVVERAQDGGVVPSVADVRRVVDKHKQGRKQPPSPAKPKRGAKPKNKKPPTPSLRDDIGVASSSEVAHLRARNEELENTKRRLESAACGLKRENADLRHELEEAKKAKRADAKTPRVAGAWPPPAPNKTLLALSALIAGGGEAMELFIRELLIAGAKAIGQDNQDDANIEHARKVLVKLDAGAGRASPNSDDGLDIPACLRRSPGP